MKKYLILLLISLCTVNCYSQKKTLVQVIKECASTVSRKGTNVRYPCKQIMKSLTKDEAKLVAHDIQRFNRQVKLSDKSVMELSVLCEKSAIKDPLMYAKTIDQFDRYSGVLQQERNLLLNKSKKGALTTREQNRLNKLNKMFPKGGSILSEVSLEEQVARLSQYTYKYSSKMSYKDFAHTVLRHGEENCYKSYFAQTMKGGRLQKELTSIVGDASNFVVKDKDLLVYIKRYNEVVGYTKNGESVNHILVWVDSKTNTITTAFPPEKNTLEKFYRMAERNAK